MPLNRVMLTINSRLYTVVADESTQYMEMLGEHINEKVEEVVKGGKNILGERPIVLAALNICDEYYKLMSSKADMKTDELVGINKKNEALRNEIAILKSENKTFREEIERLESGQITIVQTENMTRLQDELKEATEQGSHYRRKIAELEGKVAELEKKNKDIKEQCDRRIDDIINSFGSASYGSDKKDNQ